MKRKKKPEQPTLPIRIRREVGSTAHLNVRLPEPLALTTGSRDPGTISGAWGKSRWLRTLLASGCSCREVSRAYSVIPRNRSDSEGARWYCGIEFGRCYGTFLQTVRVPCVWCPRAYDPSSSPPTWGTQVFMNRYEYRSGKPVF